jgi:putative ABC transport system substrate-binding protein
MKRHHCLLTLLFFLAPLSLSAGRKVAIVRSSSFQLFDRAVQGFNSCNKSAEQVADVTLTDNDAGNASILNALRAKKPDVIVAMGTTATRFMREKDPSVPTVYCMVIDPASSGVVPPGSPLDMDPAAQVAFIRKNFPRIKRVGVLYGPGRNIEEVAELKHLRDEGEAIVLLEVPSVDKLTDAVINLRKEADCLLMLADPVLYSARTAAPLILQTIQTGLPVIAPSTAFVKAGALVGLQAEPEENGCDAAGVVGRVLKGERPSSIPLTRPTRYGVSLNLVVAERLKTSVPADLIQSAEEVIK